MMMYIKNMTLFVILLCQKFIKCDEEKIKREVPFKSYENSFSGFSPLAHVLSGLKYKGNVKTTVEYWPPDMNKEKFFQELRGQDDFMSVWFNKKPFKIQIEEPEKIQPEIKNPMYVTIETTAEPYTTNSQQQQPNDKKIYRSSKLKNKNKHSPQMLTEIPLVNDSFDLAITNTGPIMFPTIEPPTTKAFQIVHIPRANKKRKLKKKVKVNPIAQYNDGRNDAAVVNFQPDITLSAFDTTTQSTLSPFIFKANDENESVLYTDILSNLSSLTELTFNKEKSNVSTEKNVDADSNSDSLNTEMMADMTTQTSFIIKVEPESVSENFNEALNNTVLVENEPKKNSSLINQLKEAIDSNDVAKVWTIMRQFESQTVTNDIPLSFNESVSEATTLSSTVRTSSATEVVRKKLQRSRFGMHRATKAKIMEKKSTILPSFSSTTKRIASTQKSTIPMQNRSTSLSTTSEKPAVENKKIKSTMKRITPNIIRTRPTISSSPVKRKAAKKMNA
jgi:hypothetical protein